MKRIFLIRAGSVALALFALLVHPLRSDAQAVSQAVSQTASRTVTEWIARPTNTSTYGSILTDLQNLAASLRAASLPDSLLAARLDEGSKKRIPSAALLRALRDDTSRFLSIASMLRDRGVFPKKPGDGISVVEQTDMLLRAGIGFPELGSALDAAIRKQGKTPAAVSRTIAVLVVAAKAGAAHSLDENDRMRLASELISGELAEKNFDSLLAKIAERFAAGLSATESLDSALETMKDAGKGRADAGGGGTSQDGDRGEEGAGSPGQGRQKGK